MLSKKIFLAAPLLFFVGISSARAGGGALVTGGTINYIDIGYVNTDSVQIRTTGGTGVCSSSGYTLFYAGGPAVISSNRVQYALQVALSAYLSGKPVDIYDDYDATPSGSSCANATQISLHN